MQPSILEWQNGVLTRSDLHGPGEDGAGTAVRHAPVGGRVDVRRVLVFGERREHKRAVVVHVHEAGHVSDRGTVARRLPAH